MKKLICNLIAIIAWFTALACLGQPQYRFTHFDSKDGLASDFAENLIQDSLGFIWVQYNGGVSRFDGYNFRAYQFNPEDSLKSPAKTGPTNVVKDSNGNVWVVRAVFGKGIPERNLMRYDRKLDGFVEHAPNVYITNFITAPYIGSEGKYVLWGSDGKGLFIYDYRADTIKQYFNHHSDSLKQVFQNRVGAIQDQGTYYIIGTQRGLWRFDKVKQTFERPRLQPQDSTILFNNPIRRIYRWSLDTTMGFWCFVQNERLFVHLNDSLVVDQSFVAPEFFDRGRWTVDDQGTFWVATIDSGLYRYDSRNSITQRIKASNEPYALRTNFLLGVTIDRDRNIWVCTNEKGISVLKRQSLDFYNYKIGGFGSANVYTAGGRDHLIVVKSEAYPPKPQTENEVYTAVLPKGSPDNLRFEKINIGLPILGNPWTVIKGKSHLWIASDPHGLTGLPVDNLSGKVLSGPVLQFKRQTGNVNMLTNFPAGLLEDRSGKLWVTTWGGGISVINNEIEYGTEKSVTHLKYNKNDSTTISSDYALLIDNLDSVTKFVQTWTGIDFIKGRRFERAFQNKNLALTAFKSSSGVIYIGTFDGLYYTTKPDFPYNFKKDPFVKKAVNAIGEDDNGRLWMSNLEGISIYDPKKRVALFFDEREGIDHTHGIIFKSSNGELITANIEGITVFDPKKLVLDVAPTVPVLTNLKVNNVSPWVTGYPGAEKHFTVSSDVTVLQDLTLDYLHNNFTLEFSAMEMTAPEKNIYRHKLEGYDPDWIETDFRNRLATYTNLPAGTYTFRVKASNHHGIWSDNERTLTVVILPPPWRTWWAYTGYSLLAIGLLLWARRNIVRQERLTASLQLAKVEQEREHFELEKAKEVDRVKTSFFTNISHEFRTPLTLIKGPVQEMLEQFKDDPKVQQRLKLVQRNSDLLLKLINQLLDLAKLESGTLSVEKSEAEVNSFVRAIASSFESMARQKGIALKVDVPGDAYPAKFDKDKVETILINLINNAIKFTPSGGTVTVKAEARNCQKPIANCQELALVVSDTGIGIPPEHQSKIFERFHQVSESHKEVGTGIGLALVKELVTLLGGEIAVESEVGKGSTFLVSIPVELVIGNRLSVIGGALMGANGRPMELEEETTTELEPPITDHGSPITDSRPQVLVVEDNADLRAFIIDCLGPEFQFHQAENGKQGLQIATEQIPDMIISDVMMPEMDGMEMTRRIKEDFKTSHIPLILLTAKSGEDSKLEGLQKGADDYLTKPFNKQELLLKVRNGTKRMQKIREKLKTEVLTSMPSIDVQSADEKFLNKVKETIIERMSDEQLSVESLADDIGMSRVQLYRKVSALTGMAVNELIRKLRLQRAAQLLSQNWGPVSQVAYEVGFSNLSYFSKVFKEEFGVLPSEYASI